MIFSGNAADWDTWKFLFEASVVTYGYDGILDGTEAVPKKSEIKAFDPETKDASELQKLQLYKLNSLAMVHLIKSMNWKTVEGKVALCIIKKTANKDYPTGSAFLAFEKLKKRYECKVSMYLQGSLGSKFYNRTQRPKEDPNAFIAELELLRFQSESAGGTFIDDDVFIEQVLAGLNDEYETLVDRYRTKLITRDQKVSLDDLRRALANTYHHVYEKIN